MNETLTSTASAATGSLGTGDAIVVRGLVKTYRTAYLGNNGAVHALTGATFSVARGKIFSLLGPNGAGKSTTLRILTTLSRPDSGQAFINGISVLDEPGKVRRQIGYVPQRSACDPESTTRENVRLQGQLHGLRGSELEGRVDGLLERFGLAEAARRQALTLSGGMRRKLDVAIGLIHEPRVLIMDEPTTGLDPDARVAVWREVERLSNGGLTILITTHYLQEAEQLAERVAIMDRGRIVVEGTPQRLKSELRGDSVNIELPAHVELQPIRNVLERVSGISNVIVDRQGIRANADHGPTAVLEMLAAVAGLGCRAVSVRVGGPSLDDVYFRHTGRSLRGDDGDRR